jgi:hypothetical protein
LQVETNGPHTVTASQTVISLSLDRQPPKSSFFKKNQCIFSDKGVAKTKVLIFQVIFNMAEV